MKELIKLHKFFIEKTPEFIGTDVEYNWTNYGLPYNTGNFTLTTKQKLYYPIAYIKFMFAGVKDLINKK